MLRVNVMSIDFDSLPTPETLTAFVHSLREDLSKAVRLWVILGSLYGKESLPLEEPFTYNEWRDTFFRDAQKSHPRESKPLLHDRSCVCARSLESWLFGAGKKAQRTEWIESFQTLYAVSTQEVEHRLRGEPFVGQNQQQELRLKPRTRLFEVTGKQLQMDFAALAEQGWLQATLPPRSARLYRKVSRSSFPTLGITPAIPIVSATDLHEWVGQAIPSDAADLFEHLGQPIRGVQRLFLDIEYIIPGRLSNQVNQWQQQLKGLWDQKLVPPIRLQYKSARLEGDQADCVVYPVCVQYFQRAPYLYAYGQSPKTIEGNLNWYDFRLDRIQKIEVLTWEHPQVPASLKARCLDQDPPSPEELLDLRAYVWGSDVHRPEETLVLRFDREFHGHYIAHTERDNLLQRVKPARVKQLIQGAKLPDRQTAGLLNVIQDKPRDIYCEVPYRSGDNNVVMRLRAWGPKVEVLLPWALRDRMAQDLLEAWSPYRDMHSY
jgi:CRISPR-associated protein (TIGR03985 family)